MFAWSLMSPPQEHDYIGLSEVSSMEGSDKISSASSTLSAEDDVKSNALNLKETELRLGLPGSESPERKEKSGWVLKSLVSGAKRGFSDAIDGSGKWGFSGGSASDVVDLGKGGGLFSPRGGSNGKAVGGLESNGGQQLGPSPGVKDGGSTPKPAQEKKAQVSAANEHGAAPASK